MKFSIFYEKKNNNNNNNNCIIRGSKIQGRLINMFIKDFMFTIQIPCINCKTGTRTEGGAREHTGSCRCRSSRQTLASKLAS